MPLDLVTGASGFIGSHLVEGILAQGRSVRALLRPRSSLQWLPEDIDVVRRANWTAGELLPAVAGVDRVYHVAGVTHAKTREGFFAFHVNATDALLDACSQAGGVSRVVVFSSLAAAGPSATGQPARESDQPAPVSWYGQSKLAQEQVVAAYRDSLSVSVIRPPAVYGPRDRDFLPLFRAAARGILPVPRGGTQSLTHVQDVVAGALAAGSAAMPSGSTYFISSREIVRWEGLAQVLRADMGRRIRVITVPLSSLALLGLACRMVERLTGRPTPLDRNKIAEACFPHWVCLPLKAERELGFRPRIGLSAGISDTLSWYRAHGWL
ncbi:MAG: NAD-dependent epimerase/dehydratase family protein [Candidatus Eisenbacteria bacterium]|jgi:nucleoside-diphosphate-sugar epimerase|nr:NAD-dependent epimerase/dehydratase family protein [Candidatus Eisenbacteria bacterium]